MESKVRYWICDKYRLEECNTIELYTDVGMTFDELKEWVIDDIIDVLKELQGDGDVDNKICWAKELVAIEHYHYIGDFKELLNSRGFSIIVH